jgi:hypothetical protein
MSASANLAASDVLTLFRETWAEREAYRIKERIEGSGHAVSWEECLKAAQIHAQKLFQPALLALEARAPLGLILRQLVGRLKAVNKAPSYQSVA